LTENTKYLAIDYGERRIGIAVTDENKKYSFSRDFLYNDSEILARLLSLIKEENAVRIIIGYPLNFKSEKTIQTLKTEEFRNNLDSYLKKNSIDAEIIFYDERFTSRIAESGILNSGMKKKKRQEKGLTDSISAQIILQDYIDSQKNLNKKTEQ
jgi:putative Holliday junction resolvase